MGELDAAVRQRGERGAGVRGDVGGEVGLVQAVDREQQDVLDRPRWVMVPAAAGGAVVDERGQGGGDGAAGPGACKSNSSAGSDRSKLIVIASRISNGLSSRRASTRRITPRSASNSSS